MAERGSFGKGIRGAIDRVAHRHSAPVTPDAPQDLSYRAELHQGLDEISSARAVPFAPESLAVVNRMIDHPEEFGSPHVPYQGTEAERLVMASALADEKAGRMYPLRPDHVDEDMQVAGEASRVDDPWAVLLAQPGFEDQMRSARAQMGKRFPNARPVPSKAEGKRIWAKLNADPEFRAGMARADEDVRLGRLYPIEVVREEIFNKNPLPYRVLRALDELRIEDGLLEGDSTQILDKIAKLYPPKDGEEPANAESLAQAVKFLNADAYLVHRTVETTGPDGNPVVTDFLARPKVPTREVSSR
jgi:hypothetical protein